MKFTWRRTHKFSYMDKVINDFGRTGIVVDYAGHGMYLIKWDDGGANYDYDFTFSECSSERLDKR